VNGCHAGTDSEIGVCDMDISERLKQARMATGEDLAALGKRIGVRQDHLRAIEDGRLADLPSGIYGRAAVKSFAAAMRFDAAEVLAECEPLLTPVDEPIAALARLRGCPVRRPDPPARQDVADHPPAREADSPFAGWRHLASAALDACVVVGLLLIVVVSALTALTVPVSALERSAPAFGLMGVLLAAVYFVCFGGVRGATVGERTLGVESPAPTSMLTVRVVGERALQSATEDVRYIQRSGERLGRSIAAWVSSAASEAKS
jgi:hypothetical protein